MSGLTWDRVWLIFDCLFVVWVLKLSQAIQTSFELLILLPLLPKC